MYKEGDGTRGCYAGFVHGGCRESEDDSHRMFLKGLVRRVKEREQRAECTSIHNLNLVPVTGAATMITNQYKTRLINRCDACETEEENIVSINLKIQIKKVSSDALAILEKIITIPS